MAHLYKNQLQVYAQKRHLQLPVYITEREGPPHACRLKSKVILAGKTYESLEYFSTVKDAENAAAKVALLSVSSDHGTEEEDPAFYKNRLQELAQKEYSCLPTYATIRSGPPHISIFSSTVEINGESFAGEEAKSKKLAEMNAAKVAYIALRERKGKQSSVSSEYNVNDAFRSPSTQLTSATGLTGSSSAITAVQVSPTVTAVQQPEMNEHLPLQAVSSSGLNSPNTDDKKFKDLAHLYKNQLQVYAQKRHLHLPVYITEREGPPHACRLKSKVILEGKTYESLEYFSTAKDAENAAAKVALMSVSSDHGTKEEDPAFFKNLLQELAQKEYSCLPAYSTTRSGPPHNSIFSSTVEINGESFVGEEAKAKKLAEMNAAKVAYIALRERKWKQSSVSSEYHVNHAFRSPMTQFTPAAGLTGAYDQGAEAKHTQMKPEFQTNFNQNICNAKVDSLPQPPSRSGLGEISGPSICSDTSPLHKKIKVFPVTPNMTLPTGATVLHRDEKWVAITMADGS